MIKRYLFVIILLFAGMMCRAQSLSLEELQSLTAMTTDQMHNYLIITKRFKPLGKTVLNGKSYEQYRSNRINPAIAETILLGQTNLMMSGNTTRQVIYHTLRLQDLNSFLTQAKRSTMTLVFQGSDAYQNIFRFDNSLFMAVINVGRDKRSGTVQLDEK
ncbi:hypothetical protein [Mucilaginibacter sp. BT774]|uniref:hypothetical protein n=1 Tax=Mucilaginibacter sp. BT774 TaxID=3062276 RepID=UPI0026746BFE|nr:hypothetical protein [Mucilaginibacter sp. BT774]MDO3624815.1 hypothetical protein [Mucilaginibacter sp. BT774]